MANKILLSFFIVASSTFVLGCTNKPAEEATNINEQDTTSAKLPSGPQKEELTTDYDIKAGKQNYKVTIHRFSDTQKPAIVDEFGDQFYDNRVQITICRDTVTISQHEFSLESFESYIPNKYKGKVMLQGIAPDPSRSTANGIVFGVAIGEPGSEEGDLVTLLLTVVPDNGKIDIRKDDNPEFEGHIEH